MSNEEIPAAVDAALVEKLEVAIRETAYMVCGEQPDVPQPANLSDMDSFLIVQVLLELEGSTGVMLLEELDDFSGVTFRDLADHVVVLAQRNQAVAELADAVRKIELPGTAVSPDQATV